MEEVKGHIVGSASHGGLPSVVLDICGDIGSRRGGHRHGGFISHSQEMLKILLMCLSTLMLKHAVNIMPDIILTNMAHPFVFV
jgi:hypothetical protein